MAIFQFRVLTINLQMGPLEKLRLQGNLLSTLVKLVYAFLWDEESILPPFIFDPEANAIGAELIPLVNSFGNRFNDFTFYEQNFQVGFTLPATIRLRLQHNHFRTATRYTPATTGATRSIPIPNGTSNPGSGCWTLSTSWTM